MMTNGTLWHYLGSFILYTLLAIGFIYVAYWYARRHSGQWLLRHGKRPAAEAPRLEVESTLTLEARKNLYVIRSGGERFLIATSMEGTQFLSRLEPAEAAAPVEANFPATRTGPMQAQSTDRGPVGLTEEPAPKGDLSQAILCALENKPAIALPFAKQAANETTPAARTESTGFGARMVQSVQWLMASRIKLN